MGFDAQIGMAGAGRTEEKQSDRSGNIGRRVEGRRTQGLQELVEREGIIGHCADDRARTSRTTLTLGIRGICT